MSVTPSSTIVGVFSDEAAAEQAVNALYNAGFRQEEIQYLVPGTPGSFFEGLKNFLTGTGDGGANLAGDLTNMGLSDNEARYYANEYNNGNPILIVRTAERGTEAMNVLRQYGAFNTQTEPGYSGVAAEDTHLPPAYTQQGGASADTQPSNEYTQPSSSGAPGQYDNVQDLETQPQAQTGEEHPYATAQPGNAAPEYDLSDQDTQIITPQNDTYAQEMDIQAQDMQANTVAPAPVYDTDNSASGTDTTLREQESETSTSPLPSATPQEYGLYQDARSSGSVSETDTHDQYPGYTPGLYQDAPGSPQAGMAVPETSTTDQTMQADTTTSEQSSTWQTDQTPAPAMTDYASPQQGWQSTPATSNPATDIQPAQASAASPEQTDELQQLQAQLQTLQQQLQEAKARLEAAKEQENQIRTVRERQQQLQAARQQLQDVQAELQATLAEYQEVQSRITQYQ